jgi:hypothetical protein
MVHHLERMLLQRDEVTPALRADHEASIRLYRKDLSAAVDRRADHLAGTAGIFAFTPSLIVLTALSDQIARRDGDLTVEVLVALVIAAGAYVIARPRINAALRQQLRGYLDP